MNLADHLRALDKDQRLLLAQRAGTTVEYLYQLAGGHRLAGALLARRIEEASLGAVTCADLRPDIFGAPQRAAA